MRRLDITPGVAAGEARVVEQQRVQRGRDRERGHREVDTAHPDRRQPDRDPQHHRAERGQDQTEREADPETLRDVGNAVDAAVAACAVQCVVEAGSTGVGGDCFVLLSRRGSTDVVAYNGSGRTPMAATPEWYESHGVATIDRNSPHAVTVPVAIEAWSRLIKDYGRRPLAAALEHAIVLARDGYAISPRIAHDIGKQRDLLRDNPTALRTFLSAGEAPNVGDVQRQPELAQSLEAISREGPDVFYRGPIAEDMIAYLRGLGGLHTKDDFARARGEYVKPITTEFRGRTIYECPPNGPGVIALMILKILSRFNVNADPLDVDGLHVEIEAARLAYAARDRLLGDPAHAEVPVDYLLCDSLVDELAAKIDESWPVLPQSLQMSQ